MGSSNSSRRSILGAAAGAGVVGLAIVSQPAEAGVSIGLNFANATGTGETLATTDTAGVSTIQQGFWNNVTINNPDGNGYGNGGALTSIVDSNDAPVTGMSVYAGGSTYLNNNSIPVNNASASTWGSDDASWGFSGTNLTLESGSTYHLPEVVVQDVPYSNYDVYVYYGAGDNGGTATTAMSVTAGATGVVDSDSTQGYNFDWQTGNWVQGANYLIFQNNTATSFTLDNNDPTDNPWNSGIAGIQIVPIAVPEPASLGLLTLGAAALLTRRRRA
jgi:hypothetical protein